MQWRIGAIRIQIGAKPFTDFFTEGHIMHAADFAIAFGCGMRHHVSDGFEIDGSGQECLAAGRHQTSFHDFLVRPRFLQTGRGEIRPDLS